MPDVDITALQKHNILKLAEAWDRMKDSLHVPSPDVYATLQFNRAYEALISSHTLMVDWAYGSYLETKAVKQVWEEKYPPFGEILYPSSSFDEAVEVLHAKTAQYVFSQTPLDFNVASYELGESVTNMVEFLTTVTPTNA